jgi:hypothetical protein
MWHVKSNIARLIELCKEDLGLDVYRVAIVSANGHGFVVCIDQSAASFEVLNEDVFGPEDKFETPIMFAVAGTRRGLPTVDSMYLATGCNDGYHPYEGDGPLKFWHVGNPLGPSLPAVAIKR